MAEDRFQILRKYECRDHRVVIRRYLTKEKFADLATTGELFLAPACWMFDKEEGYFTLADQRARERCLGGPLFGDRAMNIARQAWDSIAEHNAKTVLMSCWTMGIEEGHRFWNEYGASREGVAIETSVQFLRSILGPDFLLIPVRYVNRDSFLLPAEHSLEPFFFKGLEFQWETELRVVGEMEMGKRLASPRRIRIAEKSELFRFITAPGASPAQIQLIKDSLSLRFPQSAVTLSSLKWIPGRTFS